MPRLIGEAVGLVVPGVYEALADFAAARAADDERRRGRMLAARGYFYRRSAWAPRLVEHMKTAQPVTILRMLIELAIEHGDLKLDGSAPRPRLPFDRSVRLVRVSADDRVMPGSGG